MTTHIEACTCPDPRCARHATVVGFSDAVQAAMDLMLYGNAYLVDGKRVPPEAVLVVDEQDCGTPEARKLYATDQNDLAEAIADQLDHALHLEGCYIGPEETHCVCLVGRIRALLPSCTEPRTQGGYFDGEATYWRCVRTVHPSDPDRHFFGQV